MNILFYHFDETCPTMGGIQRTTAIVADGLKNKYGHKCYNIYNYKNPYPPEVPRFKYEVSERMPETLEVEEVARFLQKHQIDIIINQMGVGVNHLFKRAIDKSGINCKLYYFHHTTPRRLWDLSFKGTVRKVGKAPTVSSLIKNLVAVATFPLFKTVYRYKTLTENATAYRRIYDEVDGFVLLSPYFYNEWQELTRIRNLSRLKAIPNARSFDNTADEVIINRKEKKVLIVSRMVEFPKQILLALKIWHKITQDKKFSDWSFDIVGSGPDLEMYKSYVKKNNIPRVKFLGRQESMPFFEKAAIFLMTSVREGWGMSVVEAMQMGCVPVAFDSFGSVREIIEDGKTGFLIKPFDKRDFVEKTKLLMSDDALRKEMASNAVVSTERFTKDKILNMWQELLTSN